MGKQLRDSHVRMIMMMQTTQLWARVLGPSLLVLDIYLARLYLYVGQIYLYVGNVSVAVDLML